MVKGQGNNQNQQEYIIAKRDHAMNFQLRMCRIPFCQCQKATVRDKGYQELEGSRISLTLGDLRQIFYLCEKEYPEDIYAIPKEDDHILQKAYADQSIKAQRSARI